MTLLAKVRALGLTMGGLHAGRHVGWTVDIEKADGARELGATVTAVCRPVNSGEVQGWEISFPVEAA